MFEVLFVIGIVLMGMAVYICREAIKAMNDCKE